MLSFSAIQKLALSFPDVTEEPHFEKISFRVNRKIFATYDAKNHHVCIKLSAIDQDVFWAMNPEGIYPVKNKWGKQGWTIIELSKVKQKVFADALTTAYSEVAPTKQSNLFSNNS